MVTIKPERLLEACVESCKSGGRGLTLLAVHSWPFRRKLWDAARSLQNSMMVLTLGTPILFLKMLQPALFIVDSEIIFRSFDTSFQYNMCSTCFQIFLSSSLIQASNNIKNFLVVISKPGLWIRVWTRQARYVAVVLLMRWVKRWSRLDISIGSDWPGG